MRDDTPSPEMAEAIELLEEFEERDDLPRALRVLRFCRTVQPRTPEEKAEARRRMDRIRRSVAFETAAIVQDSIRLAARLEADGELAYAGELLARGDALQNASLRDFILRKREVREIVREAVLDWEERQAERASA